MFDFEHVTVESEPQALDLLRREPASRLIAGGTDLLVLMKEGVERPRKLIDIKMAPGLRGVAVEEDRLRVGALTTLSEIVESEVVDARFTALSQAAASAASPQLRNVATIGGNLLQRPRCWYFRSGFDCWLRGGDVCYAANGENHHHAILGSGTCVAVQPSDLAPALVTFDAEVEIASSSGRGAVPVESFFRVPTADRRIEHGLEPGSIITSVNLPVPAEGMRSVYLKVMERKAWGFALVSVAVRLRLEQGNVSDVRIVLGGVAITPWRCTAAEETLLGRAFDSETIGQAADRSVEGAHPLRDNGYKVVLARNLVKRALEAFV